ncbi:hypothetical protein [Paenarthrobacter nicotinovorans]|uniref:hypothetical protein n=1 Tax=Paenarthrobacter nicotinovorans TaxID=29320 RepID=UPI0011A19EF6|nr:hypothetical protein [Paenarthrobacter nicotinovorans]
MATKRNPVRPAPNAVFGKLGKGLAKTTVVEDDLADVPSAELPSKATPAPDAGAPSVPAPVAPVLPAPAMDESDSKPVPVQFFFTESIREAFKAKARELKVSQPTLVMLAIQASYKEIPALLGPAVSYAGPDDIQLFDFPKAQVSHDEDGLRDAPITMKMRGKNLKVIDGIKEQFKASSRNQLVFVCVKHFLSS